MELKAEIDSILRQENVSAGAIVCLVGSFSTCTLRMAGAKEEKTWNEELEIVSATGTVSVNGSHIHIAISDEKGIVFGGHFKSGIVRTTAELVILAFDDTEYSRELDSETGYKELKIK